VATYTQSTSKWQLAASMGRGAFLKNKFFCKDEKQHFFFGQETTFFLQWLKAKQDIFDIFAGIFGIF